MAAHGRVSHGRRTLKRAADWGFIAGSLVAPEYVYEFVDKLRGFLIGSRRGLGGCNPKSPFRLQRRLSATLIFVSLMPQYANPG
jgi:hypothetical protein